jgi:hypothetical protein
MVDVSPGFAGRRVALVRFFSIARRALRDPPYQSDFGIRSHDKPSGLRIEFMEVIALYRGHRMTALYGRQALRANGPTIRVVACGKEEHEHFSWTG